MSKLYNLSNTVGQKQCKSYNECPICQNIVISTHPKHRRRWQCATMRPVGSTNTSTNKYGKSGSNCICKYLKRGWAFLENHYSDSLKIFQFSKAQWFNIWWIYKSFITVFEKGSCHVLLCEIQVQCNETPEKTTEMNVKDQSVWQKCES